MTHSVDPFKTALQFTLKWEGGSGHPEDLAGKVDRGITQATYDTYRRHQGLPEQFVSQMTESELEEIYYRYYWQRCHAERMCLPLSVVQFDTAVNFHVRGSIEFLQEALGVTVDGDFGPQTQAALAKQNNLETAQGYCQERMAYRQQRVKANPSQEIFLEGWLRRDRDLLHYIEQLSLESVAEAPPIREVSPEPQVEIAEKLQQAIALLQEVVDLLKTRH
jgi:lysozyme family protein